MRNAIRVALGLLLGPLPLALLIGWGVSESGVYLRDEGMTLIGEAGFWWGFVFSYKIMWAIFAGAAFLLGLIWLIRKI